MSWEYVIRICHGHISLEYAIVTDVYMSYVYVIRICHVDYVHRYNMTYMTYTYDICQWYILWHIEMTLNDTINDISPWHIVIMSWWYIIGICHTCMSLRYVIDVYHNVRTWPSWHTSMTYIMTYTNDIYPWCMLMTYTHEICH